MSLSAEEAQRLLTPFVEQYSAALNNGEFHRIGPDFYDENAVMVEKGKSCVWGQQAIGEELKKLATEFGKTKFEISNSKYEGVGDFINIHTDFVFDTELAGVLKGHYLQIWRKHEDKYLIYHDEFEMF